MQIRRNPSAPRVINALAKSLAAPSGVSWPVGNPSAASLNLGLAAEMEKMEHTNSMLRSAFLRHRIPPKLSGGPCTRPRYLRSGFGNCPAHTRTLSTDVGVPLLLT